MKNLIKTIVIIFLLTGCAGGASTTSGADELDLAIRDASDYLNDNIPQSSMIVILNMQSDSAALSDYIIDELISNAVNDRVFTVVDRHQLDQIRTEQNFQLSGEVDDNKALEIGRFFGAQTIVSGRVSQVGERYRLTIRALEVQTARVQGQYNRNIPPNPTITALLRSGARAGSGTQAASARQPGSTTANTGGGAAVTSAAVIETVPEGVTPLSVNNASGWNTAVNTIRNGGNNQMYYITVNGNVSVPTPPANENIFGSVTGIEVTIQGSGTLALSVSGCLLQIGAGQTVVLRNVTMRGRSDNNSAIVRVMSGSIFRMEGSASVTENTNRSNINGSGVLVDGGTFIMQDNSSITANINNSIGTIGVGVRVASGTFIMHNGSISGNNGYRSAGVYIASGGTFTMENGTISGNTSNRGSAGGVYIGGGTFTMENGIISGNTSREESGGGVYLDRGTFVMRGGMITGGNNAKRNGAGVYINNGTFTKTGGTISGNDVALRDRNTATEQGHALYLASRPARWRNATAGQDDNSADYGFWLND